VLANQLAAGAPNTPDWDLIFTAYADGIVRGSALPPGALTVAPVGTLYHVNYYQRRQLWPRGDAVPGAINVNVTDTVWGNTLEHTSIDGSEEVQTRIQDGFHGEIDPQHFGLIDMLPR
jgi:hypothetical protein